MWQLFHVHSSLYRIIVSGKSFLLMGLWFRWCPGDAFPLEIEDGQKRKAYEVGDLGALDHGHYYRGNPWGRLSENRSIFPHNPWCFPWKYLHNDCLSGNPVSGPHLLFHSGQKVFLPTLLLDCPLYDPGQKDSKPSENALSQISNDGECLRELPQVHPKLSDGTGCGRDDQESKNGEF